LACVVCTARQEAKRVKWRYGITLEQITAQLKKQDGKCAICQDELTRSYVDHKHNDSRTFRGLLCSNCNGGIGLLKDNPSVIQRAAEYVRWDGFEEEVDPHDANCAAA